MASLQGVCSWLGGANGPLQSTTGTGRLPDLVIYVRTIFVPLAFTRARVELFRPVGDQRMTHKSDQRDGVCGNGQLVNDASNKIQV